MSGDPRDILRLKHCPRCGYDLATLPRQHRCPECAFEYDESYFDVQGCPWLGIRWSLLGLVFGLSTLVGTGFWWVGVIGIGVLLRFAFGCAVIFGILAFLAARTRQQPQRRVRRTFTRFGITEVIPDGNVRTGSWRDVTAFSMSQHGETVWRLNIRMRFPSRFFARRWAEIRTADMEISCSAEEAELIHAEISGRIRAARQEKQRAGNTDS